MSETRILSKLPLLRRAVELNPDFEVARFHLALTSEKLWRTRQTLEAAGARDFVCAYYRDVVAINPGNVAAWSHLGYVLWLIGDSEQARSAYESGLQYKDIGLPGRIRASVESFVRNEFAEGCWNLYLRSSDRRFLDRARADHEATRSLDPVPGVRGPTLPPVLGAP
jgi:tetratricopeptide (TPR) repeat protein